MLTSLRLVYACFQLIFEGEIHLGLRLPLLRATILEVLNNS